MNRFENVDVLAAQEQLMRQNTAFYQSDFEIDKEIIGRAAASDKAEDKTLLWMSRPSGTHCFRESDVYLQGTRQHNTWKFYGEQTTCGKVNKGKFCSNCGAKKPASAPLYRCDKCGWEPADPAHPPKFCPECGDVFDEKDVK